MTHFDPIEVRRAQFDGLARQRHLDKTVRETRLIGILFAAIGGIAILAAMQDSRRTPTPFLAGMSVMLVAPGVLYVLAGVFLKRRRYWAWMTTVVMTVLLLLAVIILSVGLIAAMIRSNNADAGWMPGIAFACWTIALGSILFSLRQCLPAILETEQQAQQGFSVIPVARLAPPADAPAGQNPP